MPYGVCTLVNHFRKFFYGENEEEGKKITFLTCFSIFHKNFSKIDD